MIGDTDGCDLYTPGFGPRPACCPPALPGSILRSLPTASSVAAAASLLCTAARPLIVVGKGAAISPGAAEEVRDGGAFSLGVAAATGRSAAVQLHENGLCIYHHHALPGESALQLL